MLAVNWKDSDLSQEVIMYRREEIEILELQNKGEDISKISHVHHAMKTYRRVEV
jgi:hypothetical protein